MSMVISNGMDCSGKDSMVLRICVLAMVLIK